MDPQEWLKFTCWFAAGGGLLKLVTFKSARKREQIAATEKIVTFWEKQVIDVTARVYVLEEKVKILTALKCDKPDCPNRF